MDAVTYEAELQALEARVDAIHEDYRNEGRNEGRRALAIENVMRVVARHGALSAPQRDAYRVRLEAVGAPLPDALQVGEELMAFPAGPDREQAVQTFVDTGRVPVPSDR